MAYENILFDPEKHTYTVEGRRVPGVTSILAETGLTPDFSLVNPVLLAQKSHIGTMVHLVTEYDDLGILDEETVSPELLPFLEAWRRFKEEFVFEPQEIELPVYSATYRYAGTLDRLGTIKGELALIDIKTSSVVNLMSVGPQTAAYEQAYKEWAGFDKRKVFKRYAVKLTPEGEFRFIPCDNKNDISVFIHALSIKNWREIKHGQY